MGSFVREDGLEIKLNWGETKVMEAAADFLKRRPGPTIPFHILIDYIPESRARSVEGHVRALVRKGLVRSKRLYEIEEIKLSDSGLRWNGEPGMKYPFICMECGARFTYEPARCPECKSVEIVKATDGR